MGIIKEDHQKWNSAAICSLWNSSETYVTKLSSSIVEQLNSEVDKGQMFISFIMNTFTPHKIWWGVK